MLHYPGLQGRHNLPEELVESSPSFLDWQAIVIEPETGLAAIESDPTGNRYLACAVAREGQYIPNGSNSLLDRIEY